MSITFASSTSETQGRPHLLDDVERIYSRATSEREAALLMSCIIEADKAFWTKSKADFEKWFKAETHGSGGCMMNTKSSYWKAISLLKKVYFAVIDNHDLEIDGKIILKGVESKWIDLLNNGDIDDIISEMKKHYSILLDENRFAEPFHFTDEIYIDDMVLDVIGSFYTEKDNEVGKQNISIEITCGSAKEILSLNFMYNKWSCKISKSEGHYLKNQGEPLNFFKH